ncbi:MAG: xanthine dehydrogenase family protein subunit M [Granulosicoccus sp.]|nr:xanthine dehydrogenase family protein subunit M [Granulosicoccus sp.]
MTDMQFSAPTTVDAAVNMLAADSNARILAGGSDLLVQMQSGLRRAEHVVDIKRIPELNTVTQTDDGGWILGAAVCSAELNENAALKAQWPGVLEAADLIGSMQVQGRATLAGNLCNASPAADSVPAMVAASATVTVAGPTGRRTIPVEQVPTAPGKTSLLPGEVIVSVNLPAKNSGSGDAYMRFIPRSEMDIAVVGVGVYIALNENHICTSARIALGAVAPTVLTFGDNEELLTGTKVDADALDNAASILQSACSPIDDKRGTAEYRKDIVGVLFRRTVKVALERAAG